MLLLFIDFFSLSVTHVADESFAAAGPGPLGNKFDLFIGKSWLAVSPTGTGLSNLAMERKRG